MRNTRIWAVTANPSRRRYRRQIGGSARGYQAIFVASATLGSPGYDGQAAVYLYIAALEVNVLNCRRPGGLSCRRSDAGSVWHQLARRSGRGVRSGLLAVAPGGASGAKSIRRQPPGFKPAL
jgi:hypothetical protein